MIVTIKKGNHFSNKRFPLPFLGKSMKRYVAFNQSAVYRTENPVNMYDVNKLFGFAEVTIFKLIQVFFKGLFGGGIFEEVHHWNSARVGFSRPDGRLWYVAYCYANGVRQDKLICPVELFQLTCPVIQCAGPEYHFLAGEVLVKMNRGNSSSWARGFKLNAYFGGDETAPNDIEIFIKRSRPRVLPPAFQTATANSSRSLANRI